MALSGVLARDEGPKHGQTTEFRPSEVPVFHWRRQVKVTIIESGGFGLEPIRRRTEVSQRAMPPRARSRRVARSWRFVPPPTRPASMCAPRSPARVVGALRFSRPLDRPYRGALPSLRLTWARPRSGRPLLQDLVSPCLSVRSEPIRLWNCRWPFQEAIRSFLVLGLLSWLELHGDVLIGAVDAVNSG